MKLLTVREGFIMYGKLGVDFFSTFELLYPNIKIRLRVIRARHNFYMVSDNPNENPGVVDCSFYTRRIALKDENHKKRTDMLAYITGEFNYLETLAITFNVSATEDQIIRESFFNNVPFRRIANAKKTNLVFLGSQT